MHYTLSQINQLEYTNDITEFIEENQIPIFQTNMVRSTKLLHWIKDRNRGQQATGEILDNSNTMSDFLCIKLSNLTNTCITDELHHFLN